MLYLLNAAYALAQAGVAIAAARVATSAQTEPLARECATWLGLGVSVVPLHAGAFFLVFIAAEPPSLEIPLFWVRAVPTLLAGALVVFALLALARNASAMQVRAGRAAVAIVAILGAVDGFVGARRLDGIPVPGYETSTALVRLAFAVLLSMTALRYGLADAGAAGRRVVARLAGFVVAILGGMAAGAAVTIVLGSAPLALGVAIAVGVASPLVLHAPAAGAGRWLARHLLLPPDDPRAVAERARTYAAAVAAARDAGPAGERLLTQMREDLGITAREHELLVHGVASRDKIRYHPVQTLGRGSTAQVELAVDEVAGRRVVVKRFKGLRDPAAVLQEARTLASVRHPRVVPFLEVDRRDDDVYLVLAYAEGGSARQLLDREGPLPPERALPLTRDLLEGLEALHAAGIVHCDVKAENLLVGADGRGLLGDFGSARFTTPDLADATLTGSGAEGSLSTVSPEALRGAAPAPTRDVYAAGALLYRLLTGAHYVDLANATVFEARERIVLDAPRLPHARVPAAVEPILRKALAKRPADRYASAREMRDALAAADGT